MVTRNFGIETEQIEFKKSTAELKEAVISICAILNKHGKGDLYFGIRNNGDIIGQKITDQTLREISQAIGNHIRPVIYPIINQETYGERAVIHVSFEGFSKPYMAITFREFASLMKILLWFRMFIMPCFAAEMTPLNYGNGKYPNIE